MGIYIFLVMKPSRLHEGVLVLLTVLSSGTFRTTIKIFVLQPDIRRTPVLCPYSPGFRDIWWERFNPAHGHGCTRMLLARADHGADLAYDSAIHVPQKVHKGYSRLALAKDSFSSPSFPSSFWIEARLRRADSESPRSPMTSFKHRSASSTAPMCKGTRTHWG